MPILEGYTQVSLAAKGVCYAIHLLSLVFVVPHLLSLSIMFHCMPIDSSSKKESKGVRK